PASRNGRICVEADHSGGSVPGNRRSMRRGPGGSSLGLNREISAPAGARVGCVSSAMRTFTVELQPCGEFPKRIRTRFTRAGAPPGVYKLRHGGADLREAQVRLFHLAFQ